jgi:hypothetical protein
MSWAEAFANRYEEWSADMTADVGFYVDLARQAEGRWSSLRSGTGGSLFRSHRRPARRPNQ